MLKAAVIIHRIGPYHVARLRAAAGFGNVVAIELSGRTSEYDWAPVDSTPFRRITLSEDDSTISYRELKSRLIGALNEEKPDVLFVNGWSGSIPLSALQWCGRNRVRAVVMSASSYSDFRRNLLIERLKHLIVRGYTAALVGGQRQADYVASLGGLPREAIFPGYDVVDNDHFARDADAARADAESIRRRLGLPDRYFLASNRFMAKKNLPVVIQAFGNYRQQAGENAWDLVLLGDGPLRSELVAQIESSGLMNAVHLPGFKQYEELPTYYGLASGFVHASTSEQWGLVVNEAMAACLPVIVSDACGCTPELVRDGVNGWLFDASSAEDLTRKMLLMSAPETDRAAMGEAGRQIVGDFGPERFAESFWKAARAARPRSLSLLTRLVLWAGSKW